LSQVLNKKPPIAARPSLDYSASMADS
jgi:hypothetical protein